MAAKLFEIEMQRTPMRHLSKMHIRTGSVSCAQFFCLNQTSQQGQVDQALKHKWTKIEPLAACSQPQTTLCLIPPMLQWGTLDSSDASRRLQADSKICISHLALCAHLCTSVHRQIACSLLLQRCRASSIVNVHCVPFYLVPMALFWLSLHLTTDLQLHCLACCEISVQGTKGWDCSFTARLSGKQVLSVPLCLWNPRTMSSHLLMAIIALVG